MRDALQCKTPIELIAFRTLMNGPSSSLLFLYADRQYWSSASIVNLSTAFGRVCVPGLHICRDKCVAYANKWRFVFGFKKTKCIIFGKVILTQRPVWLLGCNTIETTDNTDILRVKFSSNLSSAAHVASARRTAFSLLNINGLCYPGLASGVKSYIWKTAVCHVLTSGCHTRDISAKEISFMKVFRVKTLNVFLYCRRGDTTVRYLWPWVSTLTFSQMKTF
jgi:hypothetical protein